MSLSQEPLEELLSGGEKPSHQSSHGEKHKDSKREAAGMDALAVIKISKVGKKSTNNPLQGSGAESI